MFQRILLFILLTFNFNIKGQSLDKDKLLDLLDSGKNNIVLIECDNNKSILEKDNSLLEICIRALDDKNDIPSFLPQLCENYSKSTNYLAYSCLCKINRIQGKMGIAKENCQKAIQNNPVSDIPYIEISKIYSMMGKHIKAIEYLQNSIDISGENFYSFYLIGLEYEKIKDYEKALYYYKKSLDISDRKNKNEKIKKILKNKISKLPDLINENINKKNEDKFNKCLKEYRLSYNIDNEKKLDIAKKCFSYKPDNEEILFEIARLSDNIGKDKEALKYYSILSNKIKDKKKLLDIYKNLA